MSCSLFFSAKQPFSLYLSILGFVLNDLSISFRYLAMPVGMATLATLPVVVVAAVAAPLTTS